MNWRKDIELIIESGLSDYEIINKIEEYTMNNENKNHDITHRIHNGVCMNLECTWNKNDIEMGKEARTSEQVWEDAVRKIEPLPDFEDPDYERGTDIKILWNKMQEIINKLNDS